MLVDHRKPFKSEHSFVIQIFVYGVENKFVEDVLPLHLDVGKFLSFIKGIPQSLLQVYVELDIQDGLVLKSPEVLELLI